MLLEPRKIKLASILIKVMGGEDIMI